MLAEVVDAPGEFFISKRKKLKQALIYKIDVLIIYGKRIKNP